MVDNIVQPVELIYSLLCIISYILGIFTFKFLTCLLYKHVEKLENRKEGKKNDFNNLHSSNIN